MNHSISGKRVAMLATHGFEQSELTEPKRLLQEAGAKVTVVSPASGKQIKGMKGDEWAESVSVDQP